MAMISLTNPLGGQVLIDTDNVLIIFFSQFLSPPNARSNVVYDGNIRSFFEDVDTVAAIVNPVRKLVRLTLPNVGGNRAQGPIWFARAAIAEVRGNPNDSAAIDMIGQQGETVVVETVAQVAAIIEQLDQSLGMTVG